MSPNYTSLIKKVKEFSKRFDCNNFFYYYINQGRHRERHRLVVCCVTIKKYLEFQLFKALMTVGLLFT